MPWLNCITSKSLFYYYSCVFPITFPGIDWLVTWLESERKPFIRWSRDLCGWPSDDLLNNQLLCEADDRGERMYTLWFEPAAPPTVSVRLRLPLIPVLQSSYPISAALVICRLSNRSKPFYQTSSSLRRSVRVLATCICPYGCVYVCLDVATKTSKHN